MKTLIATVVFLVPAAAPAIAQPHIAAVVSAADFQRGVALGGIGTIWGTGLSDKLYQTTTIPYAWTLGNTEVFVCLPGKVTEVRDANCVPLRLLFVSPNQINFLVFDSLPILPGFGGNMRAVVRVKGVMDDGAPLGNSAGDQITSGQYEGNPSLSHPQPRVFFVGYDCFIDNRFPDAQQNCGLSFTKPSTASTERGAVTDQQGRVLSSSNPARIGQYYTIWMTGLGPFANAKPQTPLTMYFETVPVAPASGTRISSTQFLANLSYVGQSPQFPGLYQVNFQLPADVANGGSHGTYFKCGDYTWEISLDLDQGGTSRGEPTQIPVVVKNGDVVCSPK